MAQSMFAPADPYTLEAQRIARARKLAEALQQQGTTPIDPNRTAGGWVVPITAGEGLGKLAQALSGGFSSYRADKQEKDLGDKYKKDLQDTITAATSAMAGSPEKPEIAIPSDEAGGGPGRSAIPAVAPDMQKAAAALMSHPVTMPNGLSMMQQDAQRKMLASALSGMGGGQPAPQGLPQTSPQGAQPQVVPGGSAGGLPMAAWLQVDPTGKLYMQQLAKDQAEMGKFIPVTEGGSLTRGGQVVMTRPKLGEGIQSVPGPNGTTTATPVPGYNEARAASISAEEQARQQVQGANTLVQVPDGKGGTVTMPRNQALAVMGGSQQPAPVPPQAPQQPTATQTPKNNIAILQTELQKERDLLARATDPRQRQLHQNNIEMIGKELAGQPGFVTSPQPVPQLAPSAAPRPFGTSASEADSAAERERRLAEVKRAENVPQARLILENQRNNLARIETQLDQALKEPGLDRAVGLVGAFPNIPGSDAANASALIKGLREQVSIMAVQAARDASRTGGAYGNMTEKEWPRLEGLLGTLAMEQDPARFREKLSEVKSEIAIIRGNLNQAFQSEYGANNSPRERTPPPARRATDTSRGKRIVVDW